MTRCVGERKVQGTDQVVERARVYMCIVRAIMRACSCVNEG